MEKKFICEFCNKNYKSYQSLWNHKHKFHEPNINQPIHINVDISTDDINKNVDINFIKKTSINTCKYCNKELSSYKSVFRHEKKCKNSNLAIKIQKMNEEFKKENEKLKDIFHNEQLQIREMFQEQIKILRTELIEVMNKQCKMHPKTLQKIKNNGIINNTNNTINIMSLGNENIGDLINESKKLFILNKRYDALRYIIEFVHFNPSFPQFHNVIVTNNRTNEAHKYDEKSKTFKIVKKDELVSDLIEYRICDIEEFYLEHEDKLNDKTKYIIKKFIDDRGDSEHIHEDIKLLLFNNKNTVKNLLTNGESS